MLLDHLDSRLVYNVGLDLNIKRNHVPSFVITRSGSSEGSDVGSEVGSDVGSEVGSDVGSPLGSSQGLHWCPQVWRYRVRLFLNKR